MLNLMLGVPEQFDSVLVHTGQHYDVNMSDVFFSDLGIPAPKHHLAVGSGSHAEVTGKTMIAFEQVLLEESPDLVVVFGDVTGTLACSLAAAKLHIKVAHVEAGLRSRDKRMPEELNRILTDALSDYLFTPSRDADDNLVNEGVEPDRIHFVGNVMVDSLMTVDATLDADAVLCGFDLPDAFTFCTLHRAATVDDAELLSLALDCLDKVQRHLPIILPMHPRTRSRIDHFGLKDRVKQMRDLVVVEPVGYRESLVLQKESMFVLTDSAGLQEESTVFKKPCLTMRPNTERPVTCEVGSATLVDLDAGLVEQKTLEILEGRYKSGVIPELWDGKASERIVDIFSRIS